MAESGGGCGEFHGYSGGDDQCLHGRGGGPHRLGHAVPLRRAEHGWKRHQSARHAHRHHRSTARRHDCGTAGRDHVSRRGHVHVLRHGGGPGERAAVGQRVFVARGFSASRPRASVPHGDDWGDQWWLHDSHAGRKQRRCVVSRPFNRDRSQRFVADHLSRPAADQVHRYVAHRSAGAAADAGRRTDHRAVFVCRRGGHHAHVEHRRAGFRQHGLRIYFLVRWRRAHPQPHHSGREPDLHRGPAPVERGP